MPNAMMNTASGQEQNQLCVRPEAACLCEAAAGGAALTAGP